MTTATAEKKLPSVNGKLAVLLVSLISGTAGGGSAIMVQWKMFPSKPIIPENIRSLAIDPYARPQAFTAIDGEKMQERIDELSRLMDEMIKEGPEEVKAQMTRMRTDIMDQLKRMEVELKDIQREHQYQRYRGEFDQQ